MHLQEWINSGLPIQRGLAPYGLPVHGPMVAHTATSGYSPGVTRLASRNTALQKIAVTWAVTSSASHTSTVESCYNYPRYRHTHISVTDFLVMLA